MKQMSDVETTTSSRPALLTVLMASISSRGGEVETVGLYHGSLDASTKAAMRIIDFYDQHPISEGQVLDGAADRRRAIRRLCQAGGAASRRRQGRRARGGAPRARCRRRVRLHRLGHASGAR